MRKLESYPLDRNDGDLLFEEMGTTFTDTGLDLNTEYFYKVYSYDEVPNYSVGASIKVTTGVGTLIYGDGTLLKGSGPKVYLIYQGTKRWITSARVFNRRNYRWDSIVEVSDEYLSMYPDGDDIPNLIRAEGRPEVYHLASGVRRHIPNIEIFNSYGFLWDEVEIVTEEELSFYGRAKHVKLADDDRVYYITNSGLKRHIISAEVFNSYGNNWAEIVIINETELSHYPVNDLIQGEGDYKVYKLENGQRRWVTSIEAFNHYKLDWTRIAPINKTELNAHPLGADLTIQ